MTRTTTFNVGDKSRIQECAPKSKTKRWEVIDRV
jgi:small subunit ribosomal protein S17